MACYYITKNEGGHCRKNDKYECRDLIDYCSKNVDAYHKVCDRVWDISCDEITPDNIESIILDLETCILMRLKYQDLCIDPKCRDQSHEGAIEKLIRKLARCQKLHNAGKQEIQEHEEKEIDVLIREKLKKRKEEEMKRQEKATEVREKEIKILEERLEEKLKKRTRKKLEGKLMKRKDEEMKRQEEALIRREKEIKIQEEKLERKHKREEEENKEENKRRKVENIKRKEEVYIRTKEEEKKREEELKNKSTKEQKIIKKAIKEEIKRNLFETMIDTILKKIDSLSKEEYKKILQSLSYPGTEFRFPPLKNYYESTFLHFAEDIASLNRTKLEIINGSDIFEGYYIVKITNRTTGEYRVGIDKTIELAAKDLTTSLIDQYADDSYNRQYKLSFLSD